MRRIVAALFTSLLAAACATAPDAHESRSPALDAPKSAEAGDIDRSCRTDADCTVKNVGNCCGYYPACVNVDSPTFPEQVKAECAKTGMSSICGFPAIEACQCVQGSCEPASAGGAVR